MTQSKDAEFDAQDLHGKTSSQFANEVVRRGVLTRGCTQLLHPLMEEDNSVE